MLQHTFQTLHEWDYQSERTHIVPEIKEVGITTHSIVLFIVTSLATKILHNIMLELTGCPGVYCLKVVEREIGGTTANDFHCSGSWPVCVARVPKWG